MVPNHLKPLGLLAEGQCQDGLALFQPGYLPVLRIFLWSVYWKSSFRILRISADSDVTTLFCSDESADLSTA